MKNFHLLLATTVATTLLGCQQLAHPPMTSPISSEGPDGKTGFNLQSTATQAGDIAWNHPFGTTAQDEAFGLSAAANFLTVVGRTYGTFPGQNASGGSDAYARKYDDNGNEVWTRQFGSTSDDRANGVVTDASGNSYVVGSANAALPGQTPVGGSDAYVRKYDINGNEVWTRQFGTLDFDDGLSIALDDTNHLYVVGQTFGTLPGQTKFGLFSADAYIRKYDGNGNEVWTRQFGTGGSEVAFSVTVDSGSVYVAGTVSGVFLPESNSGGFDAFVRKYDANGNALWTRQFGSSAMDQVSGVAADATGVYLAGVTDGILPGQSSSGAQDAFVRRYDASGNEVWTRQFGSSSMDRANGIAVDASGVYLAGVAGSALPGQTSSGGNDAYVRKYDVAGNERWTRQFGTASFDVAEGIAVLASGIYVAGTTSGPGGFDAFVAKLLKEAAIVEAVIDIKPGTFPNSLNLKSNGSEPVAIMGSGDVDASQINLSSVSLAGAAISRKKNGAFHVSLLDINGDGRLDLLAQFPTKDLQLSPMDTAATLEGQFNDGTAFEGTDSVRIVN